MELIMAKEELIKTETGEVYYRDEAGALFLSESFVDKDGGVSSVEILIEEN